MRLTTCEQAVVATDAFAGTLTEGVERELACIGEAGIYRFRRHGSEIGRIALRRLAQWSAAAIRSYAPGAVSGRLPGRLAIVARLARQSVCAVRPGQERAGAEAVKSVARA